MRCTRVQGEGFSLRWRLLRVLLLNRAPCHAETAPKKPLIALQLETPSSTECRGEERSARRS